jgi:hypothetical protein
MTSEPKVPLSQRRGTSSEAEIKAILNNFSITAKPDPDIGIDYYCELLSGETPIGKFFGVQAKGKKDIKDKQLTSIKKSTIRHWSRLPYPVFIVASDKKTGDCYWISITDNLAKISLELENNHNTISIEIDKSHKLSRAEDGNQDFVSKIKKDIDMISLILGHPQFGEGYVRRIPVAYLSSDVRIRLEENIRTSLNCLIDHWLLEDKIEIAYTLCKFLTDFDKAHYDHFYKFGQINKLMGNKTEAKKAFEEAKRLCREDKKWNLLKEPSDPAIEYIIGLIQTEIEKLN